MRFFSPLPPNGIFSQETRFSRWGIVKLALLFGLPLVGLVLAGAFIVGGKLADDVVSRAISRNLNSRAMALGLEIERLLSETRTQLLYLAAGPPDRQDLARRFKMRFQGDGMHYREVAFIGVKAEDRFLLLNYGGEVVNVLPEDVKETRGNLFESISSERRPGYVFVSAPQEVIYSMVPIQGVAQNLPMYVMRFTTPVYDPDGSFSGLLILSLDLSALRDRLSYFRADDSPFASAGDSPGRAFLFDINGWMLFQSETTETANSPLSCEAVRTGLRGDFGRPGFSIGFRPAPEHEFYWAMVSDVQSAKHGQFAARSRFEWPQLQLGMEYINYTPIRFKGGPDSPPIVIAGLACLDHGDSSMQFTMRLISYQAMGFFAALTLVGLTLLIMGKILSRGVRRIASAVREQNESDKPQMLNMGCLPMELDGLRLEIDRLLERLIMVNRENMAQKAAADAERQRMPAITADADMALLPFTGVVGNSLAIKDLRLRIQKAAQVSADILITGETGTGKEMAAETIHRESEVHDGPFITINCGALDENLLLDTLFGHVKGAFTEARNDRKGAFLAAEGGTLLLDEIGNASLKVQQALLRALAARRIRPLGSDQDIPFSARIIAATNEDLMEAVKNGAFREDLYYRLAVITVTTPSLREHKEDIPLLARHFLNMCAAELKCPPAVLTQGALEKLLDYDWPGNVREIKNCLTRAVTFSSTGFIYAENLSLNGNTIDSQLEAPLYASEEDGNSPARDEYEGPALNRRQKAAWPFIIANGGISRQEYQEKAGAEISMRTAQYDLQDLVVKGILIKKGKGPASSYMLADGVK